MGWSIGFQEYQFTSNEWVLTCKNSYLEELIPRQKLEKPDFWENPHFHVFIVTQLGWVLWKNSYLKVLPNYFLDHEKHFEYLQLVDTTKTKKYMRHRRSFENTKFVILDFEYDKFPIFERSSMSRIFFSFGCIK